MFAYTNSEWIQANFMKRECNTIILSSKDPNKCCCGLQFSLHKFDVFKAFEESHRCPESNSLNEVSCTQTLGGAKEGGDKIAKRQLNWNPAKHTIALPTDAHGCIDFRVGAHPNKAQYIRLSYDSQPQLVMNLLLREWGLERPKLLISVSGGKTNFELQPCLKRCLRKALLKTVKTTGAWIFTSGINAGTSRHVGDAFVTEKSPRIRGGRVVSIGFTPWGMVERRNELVDKTRDVPFHPIPQPRSRFMALNKYHSYFLLVDNGTVGKYGAEIGLRRKLEKYISSQKLGDTSQQCSGHFSTPLVCLVIEGGTNTIRSVLEYVTDSPPVPVVVCDGTGRAADLIAFVHKYHGEFGNESSTGSQNLLNTIRNTFNVGLKQAEKLQQELNQCIKRRHLITIFRANDERDEESELDRVILTALFKSQNLNPVQQLSLALTWNRSDIARKEIFTFGQEEWPAGALDLIMYDALVHDRVDFVRLLLENGFNVVKFLSISRLNSLYNTKHGPVNTLEYLVRDVYPRMPRSYQYTLIDIGLVINQLMGGAYRSRYTTRSFRYRYDFMMQRQKNTPTSKPSPAAPFFGLQRSITSASIKLPHFMSPRASSFGVVVANGSTDEFIKDHTFEHPFGELIVWAVLTKRQEMAKLMWEHGEEAMAKALVASKLYKAMAAEAADDDLDVELYDELLSYGKVFESLALQLLDYCYQMDHDLTQQLLTVSLENWSRQTCLSLGVSARNLGFLSHPLSQTILADLWMGGLRMRKNPSFKIILGLLFPFSILKLDFKSREELELMPQTEEEYIQDREDDRNSCSSVSSSTNSRRSSTHFGGSIASLENNLYSNHSNKLVDGCARQRSISFCKENENCINTHCKKKENGADLHYKKNENYPNAEYTEETSTPMILSSQMLPPLSTFTDSIGILRKKARPLKWKTKFYEFYAAPISKFYSHFLAYVVFLMVYTYVCLVKKTSDPSWHELYVVLCMVSFGVEKFRQILVTEPTGFFCKFVVWFYYTKWNICDLIAISAFLFAFFFRLNPQYVRYSHVIYSTGICYWYIRVLKLLSVNKYFGPFVMMMSRMIENLIYFVVLLLVVLMAFGVSRQSILFPNEEWDWMLVKHIFYQPYFMLYGEVFAPDISPQCDATCDKTGECGTNVDGTMIVPCHTGRWITPIIMTVYLLVANILLINLLIALFNTIYNSVDAISHQFWNFQRFNVIMEYEEKPCLPAPLILITHMFRMIKHVRRKLQGRNQTFESGLKLFLSRFELERLYDFEEECVQGFMRGVELANQQTTEIKIQNLIKATDSIKSKLDDFERWEAVSQENFQSLKYRLQRVEELEETLINNLDVIHRYMSQNRQPDLERSPSPSSKLESASLNRVVPSSYDATDIDSAEREKVRFTFDTFDFDASVKENVDETFEVRAHHEEEVGTFEISKTNQNLVENRSNSRNRSQSEASNSASSIHQLTPAASSRFLFSGSSLTYTSITDALESSMLPVSVSPSTSEPKRPSIEIDCLRNAEETHYNLMETIIKRRLRRNSTNLLNSLEDLINVSIREDLSSAEDSTDNAEKDQELDKK